MANYDEIGAFRLKNQGGFVVKMDFLFGKDSTNLHRINGSGKNITLGCSETKDPGEYGVHDGDVCTIHADVVAGKDKAGKSYFIYREGNSNTAEFTISGTTLDNELGFNGINAG
ncbi:MAG: hypothetical protein HFJ09_12840 [Lachnospiraceae bacterium]|nr:hypothetical protein [Lachnospiraceae bacterium]